MTTTLLLPVPDPKMLVSANRKLHFQHAGKVRAYWRIKARDTALDAYGHADQDQAWHQRARIILTFRFPDRRRHDTPNLYSYVGKPIVDGLVDARCLPDDSDDYLIGPDMRRHPGKGPHAIAISIVDLAADWALHLDDGMFAVEELPLGGVL